MSEECRCERNGICDRWNRWVSATGFRVCKSGDQEKIDRYFGRNETNKTAEASTTAKTRKRSAGIQHRTMEECAHLGGPIVDYAGTQQTTECSTCKGKVRLKLYECHHPDHDSANSVYCTRQCRDFTPREIVMPEGPQDCLTWRIAHFSMWQSLGILSFELAYQMEKRGVPVFLSPIHGDRRFLPVDDWTLSHLDEKKVASTPWVLQSSASHTPGTPHQKLIKLTCQDSDGLQPRQKTGMDACVSVMGLSHFNKDCWTRLGVQSLVGRVPLAIKTDVFNQIDDPPTSPFVFGTSGRLQHGPKRKNLKFVADVFHEICDQMPDARLRIRITPGDKPRGFPQNDRIEIQGVITHESELLDWYRSLSCYVCASRCESWGLMPHEAMGCGRPVIMNAWGGVLDYWLPECGWELDYRLEPRDDPMDGGSGNWASPTAESLAEAMLDAYNNRDQLAIRGRAAALRAAEFTWEKSAEELHKFLVQCGMLDPSTIKG